MFNIKIFRIIIISFIFYSSLAFASDDSLKYRIQVLLICNEAIILQQMQCALRQSINSV
jgi:hypothetical protein